MRCTQFARTVNTIHLDNRKAVSSAFTGEAGEGSSIIVKRSSVVVDLFQDSWLLCLLEALNQRLLSGSNAFVLQTRAQCIKGWKQLDLGHRLVCNRSIRLC